MAFAFVLLTTDMGAENEVMKDLKQVTLVKEAHTVYGKYDIIARVEADTMEDLKNVISWKVCRVDKVRSTLSMITT